MTRGRISKLRVVSRWDTIYVKDEHTDQKHSGFVLDISGHPIRMHSSRRHFVATFALQ